MDRRFTKALFDEAFSMLVQARDVLDETRTEFPPDLGPGDRLALLYERMRLSTMVMESMAWLLARKAVEVEELSLSEALSEEWRLAGMEVCLRRNEQGWAFLTPTLHRLLERGARLYERIMRIEGMEEQDMNRPSMVSSTSVGAVAMRL